MGRFWVGFQAPVKRGPGPRTVVQEQFQASISDADLVRVLTTRDGLSSWLAEVTAFSARPGGDIDFVDAEGTFGGTYARQDVPKRVTLVTERHGEIDVRLRARDGSGTQVTITITCVAETAEATAAAQTRASTIIQALKARCSDGH